MTHPLWNIARMIGKVFATLCVAVVIHDIIVENWPRETAYVKAGRGSKVVVLTFAGGIGAALLFAIWA